MRDHGVLVGILAIVCFFVQSAWPAPGMPKNVSLLVNDLSLSDQNNLWPGYSPLFKPVGLHIKGVGSYIINNGLPYSGGKVIKGSSSRVTFMRNRPADTMASDFSANYFSPETGNVFLYNYSDRSVPEAEMIIVHEMFHLFQQGGFKDTPLKSPLPGREGILASYLYDLKSIYEWGKQLCSSKSQDVIQDPPVSDISLAYVEDRLLSQALLDRLNYRALAAEFVRMREYRRKKLHRAVLEREITQERFEGTAEYVGWKSVADNFGAALAENYQAGMLLSPQPLANRDRRYYSPGAAQCFLLDRLGVAWKLRVQNGEDIFRIMKESFPPDKYTRTIAVLRNDFYSDWVKDALVVQSAELSEKKLRTSEWLRKYDGWKFVFGKNMNCDGQSRTCFDEPIELQDGGQYLSSCHTELRCSWGSMSIESPIIDAPREVAVFLGDAPTFEIYADGVKKNRVMPSLFSKNLHLETDGLSVDLKIPGRIRVVGKTITVEPIETNISELRN